MIGVGCWQLLPRLESDSAATVATAAPGTPRTATPTVDLVERLAAQLLPPDALPRQPKWSWHAVPDGAQDAFLPMCDVSPEAGALAAATRTYATEAGQTAVYHLYAFPTAAAAAAQTDRMNDQMKGKCPTHLLVRSEVGGPDKLAMLHSQDAAVHGLQTWLARQGQYVAVLYLLDPGNPGSGKSDSAYENNRPDACIARSLNRLASGKDTVRPTTPTSSPTPSGSTDLGTRGSGSSGGTGTSGTSGSDVYILPPRC